MKLHRLAPLILAVVATGLAQTSHTSPKVALINLQDAIIGTTDGQNAAKQLDAEFSPRKAELDQEQKTIADLQGRLNREKLSDADREKLTKEINDRTVILNVKTDQADKDLVEAQRKVMAELGKKMVSMIVDYAAGKGYNIVFDTSTSTAPLLYADNATDITADVVAAYESRQKAAAGH